MQASRDLHALTRLAFGQDRVSASEIASVGLRGWIDDQLHPAADKDADCTKRLEECRLRIAYPDGSDWSAIDEKRPLQWLEAPIDKLYTLTSPPKPIPHPEKVRPRAEVIAATLLRAVYSRYQLREVLCDFWHNHFSVNAWDTNIGIAFPVYAGACRSPPDLPKTKVLWRWA